MEPETGKNQEDIRTIWNVNNTKLLIDLYKKYRDQVGTLRMKSLKCMWKIISEEITRISGNTYTAVNCENRWRVIERNYKKYADNQNSIGRGRKFYEFAEEMDDIFGKKKNLNPVLLLSNEQIHIPTSNADIQTEIQDENNESEKQNENEKTRKTAKKRKLSIMEQMREDRLNYQKKRLNIESEKLEILKNYVEFIKHTHNGSINDKE